MTADALASFAEIEARLAGKRASVFLDYDGTLTPIVASPELALLSQRMRAILLALAARCSVAIVSGRDLADVKRLVGLDNIVYAGSHGFDISGPNGLSVRHKDSAAFREAVKQAAKMLASAVAPIKGALVEPKRFAVAVHYRQVGDADVPRVEAVVDDVLKAVPELRKTYGKKVYELRPRFDWDKGKAVRWLMEALGQAGADVVPFFLGDDFTDEDAFAALADIGVTIFVGAPHRTVARYTLADTDAVATFLSRLTRVL